MMHRWAAIALATLIATTVLPLSTARAADAPAAKPLRTLVYSITFGLRSSNEEKTSGFLGGGQGAMPYGSANVRRTAIVDDSGTLTVDVIAASNDGGLVVDTTFSGKATVQPRIRVAIFPDGRLSFPPSPELSAEAMRLLPLLARGVVAGRDVSPGSSWSIELAPPAKGSSTYHVNHLDGSIAVMAIETQFAVAGPQGFDEHGRGTAEYDTTRLCPITYDLTAISRHQPAMDQYVTSTAHLVAKLVSDSFAKSS